jgi:hypothetical protein
MFLVPSYLEKRWNATMAQRAEIDWRLEALCLDDEKVREAWASAECTSETMDVDPWTAVYLPIPENASHDLLLAAQLKVDACGEDRALYSAPLIRQGNDGRTEIIARAEERAKELSARLDIVRQEEFAVEDGQAVTARPWDIVHMAIPSEADAELLASARGIVDNCLRRLDEGDVSGLNGERFDEWYKAAVAKVGELDARLEVLERAASARTWSPDASCKLPPDPEKMNDDRAEWAATALRHFQCCTGADYEDTLTDLLGDLMHWADRNGVDFNDELARARTHYDAEIAPELARADPYDERYPGVEREDGGPEPEQAKSRSR